MDADRRAPSRIWIALSAEQATVTGRAFEKSVGRPRWIKRSITRRGPATKPPAPPPKALPRVPVNTSTRPFFPGARVTHVRRGAGGSRLVAAGASPPASRVDGGRRSRYQVRSWSNS